MKDGQRANLFPMVTSVALLVSGLSFAGVAVGYELGSLSQFGPGFFPFVCGLMLAGFACADIVVTAAAHKRGEAENVASPAPPWRQLFCLCGSLLCFAILLKPAGFVPAVFLTSAIAMLADPQVPWIVVLLYSAVLAFVSYLIFLLGLGIPLSAFV